MQHSLSVKGGIRGMFYRELSIGELVINRWVSWRRPPGVGIWSTAQRRMPGVSWRNNGRGTKKHSRTRLGRIKLSATFRQR